MQKITFALLLTVFFSLSSIEGAPEIKQDAVEFLRPKLNSDRIAYFFGSYGVEPIPVVSSPFGESRIANLYSIHDGQKIMRTLAIVNYEQPIHEDLKQVHADINKGQSIGIALRQHGWIIDKVPLYFGSIALSPQLKKWMQEKDCDQAAVHIYKLHVSKKPCEEPLHYCTIIEVHSPQYLDENWLQLLYPDQYQNYHQSLGAVDGLLKSLATLITEFPQAE